MGGWRRFLWTIAIALIALRTPAFAETGNGQTISPNETGKPQVIKAPDGKGYFQTGTTTGSGNVTVSNPEASYTCFQSVKQNAIRGYTRDMSPAIPMTGCPYRDLLFRANAVVPDSVSIAVFGITLYNVVNGTIDTLSTAVWAPIRATASGVAAGDTVGTLNGLLSNAWTDTTLDFTHEEFAVVLYGKAGMKANAGDGANSQGLGSTLCIPLNRTGTGFTSESMAIRVRLLQVFMSTGTASNAIATKLMSGAYPAMQYTAWVGGRR